MESDERNANGAAQSSAGDACDANHKSSCGRRKPDIPIDSRMSARPVNEEHTEGGRSTFI